jgi:hypothetical protein
MKQPWDDIAQLKHAVVWDMVSVREVVHSKIFFLGESA